MAKEARKVVFEGRVQGVGFRMTAMHLAEGLPVSGTVRNLEDGRVELVVEGEMSEIEKLIERLREHFGSYIRSVEQSSVPAGGFRAPGVHISF